MAARSALLWVIYKLCFCRQTVPLCNCSVPPLRVAYPLLVSLSSSVGPCLDPILHRLSHQTMDAKTSDLHGGSRRGDISSVSAPCCGRRWAAVCSDVADCTGGGAPRGGRGVLCGAGCGVAPGGQSRAHRARATVRAGAGVAGAASMWPRASGGGAICKRQHAVVGRVARRASRLWWRCGAPGGTGALSMHEICAGRAVARASCTRDWSCGPLEVWRHPRAGAGVAVAASGVDAACK